MRSLIPSLTGLSCILLLTGCDPEPPQPVELSNNNSTPTPEVDFDELLGQNVDDPNTSVSCPLGISCALLPGESSEPLTSGSCEESHFRVKEGGARTFVDEVTRTHRTGGRLASLESDLGTYTIGIGTSRITSFVFEPQVVGERVAMSFTYRNSRLSEVTTERDGTTVEERTYTYDADNRTATAFVKTRQPDGSFVRTSQVYNYTGERTREIWQDLDVNEVLSEPDMLASRSNWREDGLLDTHTSFEGDEEANTVSFLYDDEGRITGKQTRQGETLVEEITFVYNAEQGLLERISFGEMAHSLVLTRDEDLALVNAQLRSADDTTLYEIEMSGSSCERPLNVWLQAVERWMAEEPS